MHQELWREYRAELEDVAADYEHIRLKPVIQKMREDLRELDVSELLEDQYLDFWNSIIEWLQTEYISGKKMIDPEEIIERMDQKVKMPAK